MTRQMKHFRYSVSRQVALTGWSAAAPRCSRTWIWRLVLWDTPESMCKKSSRMTCPEQLHVTRIPPGSNASTAIQIDSMVGHQGFVEAARLRANLGGSRITAPNRSPAATS